MEELTMEWIKQLTRISKSNLATYANPMTLVNYLLRELERFKDYLPMIAAMRAKGLEKRHWQNMSKQLDMDNLDTQNLTLAHLIEMRLFEGPQLELIKTVSDIAMKEWAIKTTLDSLEGELRVIEFTVSKYKDPVVAHVLKGLEELMGMFEDFVIKTVSLKQNQFARVFSERIVKVEKEFKMIVDVLEEWIKTQKAWIYLEPIFSQKDLADQMKNEAAKFAQVDNFYKKEINMIQQDPNVHRYCRREIILTSLQYANKEFEVITKGLTVYLEAKRGHFSRFYFLSNEEIIEILG
jgi:dynein heavy chain, axonemal